MLDISILLLNNDIMQSFLSKYEKTYIGTVVMLI